MVTINYAMVRGSTLRVTALDPTGRLAEPGKAAVSRSVTRVNVNEVTDSTSAEAFRDDRDQARLVLDPTEDTIGFTVDAEFLRCDPGLLSLLTGVPLAYNAAGDVVGFDAQTNMPVAAFALEVWSKLSNQPCPPSQRKWGYTLFPFLAGGTLTGFKFGGGLVTFGMKGAMTRMVPKWGIGPYDIDGTWGRLVTPVSRNDAWQQMIVSTAPPAQRDGIYSWTDTINNGTAANPMPDPTAATTLDAGHVSDVGSTIIDGGGA